MQYQTKPEKKTSSGNDNQQNNSGSKITLIENDSKEALQKEISDVKCNSNSTKTSSTKKTYLSATAYFEILPDQTSFQGKVVSSAGINIGTLTVEAVNRFQIEKNLTHQVPDILQDRLVIALDKQGFPVKLIFDNRFNDKGHAASLIGLRSPILISALKVPGLKGFSDITFNGSHNAVIRSTFATNINYSPKAFNGWDIQTQIVYNNFSRQSNSANTEFFINTPPIQNTNAKLGFGIENKNTFHPSKSDLNYIVRISFDFRR